ncbi:T9SS type A sorting domain-containing protein, partial [Bacteroidota bacterium]
LHDISEEMLVSGNRIRSQQSDKGIYLYNCDATTPSFHGLVSNNEIHVGGNYTAYGFELNNCAGTRLFNNSVYITSTYSTPSYTLGIYIQGNNADIEVANNNVFNAGKGYAYYVVDEPDIASSDYNNFYTGSDTKFAYWEGSDYNNIAALMTASGKDLKSVELNPRYVSTTDLRSGQQGLLKKAIPVEGVTVDIDGVTRDVTTPDIGAYEFTCVTPDFNILVGISCLGDSTIFIDISDSIAPGSTVGYNFSGGASPEVWAKGAGDTISHLFANAGKYAVKYFVYQIAGCSDNYAFETEVIAAPELNITTQGASCKAADGWASVRVTNGNGPYSYFWSTGDTDTITRNLTLGTYTIAVSDTSGCSTTEDILIAEAIQVTITQLKPSTCGIPDGSAVVTATGGKAPYKYVWSNGETTDTNKVMSAGLHYVNVIDSDGCYVQGSINLANDGSGPQITLNKLVSNDCYGDRLGSVDISVSGGNSPYEIGWSNGAITEDIDSLAAGIYNVIAKDVDGCLGAASFEIIQPSRITVSPVVTQATCAGADGRAVAVASGGTVPYIYKWSTGGIYQIEEGLAAGVYSVTIKDAKGCEMVAPILVNNVGGPVVTFTDVQGTACQSPISGSITTSVTGGVPTYNYSWSPGGQTSENVTSLAVGTYSVKVTDFNGCVGVNAVTIKQDPPDINPICLVTVDTATDMNMIVWEKTVTSNVSHYNIYRESSIRGDYQLIGSRDVDSLSIFVDSIADPTLRSWRYRLSVVDNCGVESTLSDPHKTMHLTLNVGLNDAVNLIWDHYEGFSVSTYNVYKYLPVSGWDFLTGISSDLTSLTDENVTEDGVYYFIEIAAPNDGCTATENKASTLNSSRSNRKSKLKSGETGIGSIIDLDKLNIYPNPSNGIFNIHMELESMDNIDIKVFDINGRLMIQKKIEHMPTQVDTQLNLSGFKDGVYHILIKTNNTLLHRMVVKI